MSQHFAQKEEQIDCLFNAVAKNNYELLRLLTTDLKIDYKITDKLGRSAMHVAAEKGADLMIYMLAEMGADVNITDNEGETPLHKAVKEQQVTSVKFLMSLGATINCQNFIGRTPLHLSVQVPNLRICKDLLLKGADRSVVDKVQMTPLQLAELQLPLDADFKKFKSVLSKQWYSGCPIGKLPYMPIEKNKRTEMLFLFLFIFIWINQIVVIEPILDVWYFMLSTTMCMAKLALSFGYMTCNKPGYLQPDPKLSWIDILRRVPSKNVCAECKVIKTPRT